MSSVFVTASGTEIGKTFVTELLIGQLRRKGIEVDAIKPVLSGFEPERARESDAGRLLAALGRPADGPSIESVSPWRFRAPLSPDMAAEREHRAIDFRAVVEFCSEPAERGVRLIEGVGGVMVPLDAGHTVLDLIEAIGAPALVVAGSYLGSISHTLTGVHALAARRIELAGIVVNASREEPVATAETTAVVRRFLPDLRVIELTRKRAGSPYEAPDLTTLLEPYLDPRANRDGPG